MSELPDLGAALLPLVGRMPEPVRPRFLAFLERAAARRYEAWADAAPNPDEVRGFRACAARENEIATRVEGLFAAQPGERTLVAGVLPDVEALAERIFGGRSAREQRAIQAAAERRGAAAWRGLAATLADPESRAVLEACAKLEEASADFLEGLLRDA